ncbi:TraG/VirB4 family ATPase [Agathobaculum sp. LCP25S3_E8]|uniref:TraG/VirB4 family ATPase n=1 Tax=Agathobaculum sp. LCP25S3_E8 TaxID=3438735 RepID=UPI003F90A66F
MQDVLYHLNNTGDYVENKKISFHTVYEEFIEREGKATRAYATLKKYDSLYQTNVDMSSRIMLFDIFDLGSQLKTVGMLVMLDAILNRVIENHRRGRRTWIYIDEIYLFFANEYSTGFLEESWKRFRKKNAAATGITQNVTDCLRSPTAKNMLANSEFLLMLSQAPTDQEELVRMLRISEEQLGYINNAESGHGLIKVGGALVPFINQFPRGTALYRLMTTKPGESL